MDVAIRCLCPPRDGELRHPDGDTVVLKDTLDFRTATAMSKSAAFLSSDDRDGREAEALARLTEGYVLFGIEAWTLVDDRGKALPASQANIRSVLLEQWDVASLVSDVADGLYEGAILLPLLRKASMSSPPSPTDASTSQPTALSKKPRRPSKRSSTSTSQTDGIVTISPSPAGGSSLSPNSALAARSAG